ncbi:MAG: PAS domain-containing protein, partial [Promethearchaeota archaeon]
SDLETREQVLENERDRLLNILNSIHHSVCIIEEDRSISYYNSNFKSEFGDPKGAKCYNVFYGRKSPCENCDLESILSGSTRQFKFEHIKKGELNKIFEVINTPFVNLEGDIKKLKILRDVSELEYIQKMFQDTQLKYQNIVEHMPLGLHMYELREDGKLYFTGANPAADKLLSIDNSQIIDKSITQAFPALAKTRIPENLKELAREGGFNYNEEIHFSNGKNKERIFENFNFQTLPGQVVSIFNDITDQKQIEKEIENYRTRLEELVVERTQKLLETKTKLQEAQKIAHLGNWERFMKTNQLIWSEEVYQIFGLESNKIDYGAYLKSIHPNDKKFVVRAVEDALYNSKAYEIEYRIILNNGTIKFLHEIAKVEHDEEGEPVKMFGTVQDITELKEAENRFIKFKEAAPDAFYIYDHDLKLVETNNEGLKLFSKNTTMADLKGKHITELVPDLKETGRYDQYKRVLETGESLTLHNVESTSQFGRKNFYIKAFRLGNYLGLIISDITEHIKIQEELKRHKKHLEELVELRNQEIYDLAKFPTENPLPVIRIENNKIIFVNDAAKEQMNLRENEEVPKYLKEPIQKALEREIVVKTQASLDQRTFLLTVVNILGSKYVNVYATDITPVIDSQRKMRSFVSNISHEIRTPLTVLNQVIYNLENFETNMNYDQRQEFLKIVSRNIHIMNNLIEDLITVSIMDERELELDLESFPISRAVAKSIESIKPKILIKEIKLELDIEEELEIEGDKRRITQVLRIFLDNAAKYSPAESTIQLKVKDYNSGKFNPKNKEGILMEIIDEGRGIKEDDLSRLFERFYRGENVRDISGTGLGLPIAKEIIELHGGKIYVESTVNEGTQFRIFIPKSNQKS